MPEPDVPGPKRTEDGSGRKQGRDEPGAPPIVVVAGVWLPELPLGRIVGTPGALQAIPADEIFLALQRHRRRDWGNLDPEDQAANQQALLDGARILSSYRSLAGVSFWIITEEDRSVTTVLLPNEY